MNKPKKLLTEIHLLKDNSATINCYPANKFEALTILKACCLISNQLKKQFNSFPELALNQKLSIQILNQFPKQIQSNDDLIQLKKDFLGLLKGK